MPAEASRPVRAMAIPDRLFASAGTFTGIHL
jgi:hypothetical protein